MRLSSRVRQRGRGFSPEISALVFLGRLFIRLFIRLPVPGSGFGHHTFNRTRTPSVAPTTTGAALRPSLSPQRRTTEAFRSSAFVDRFFGRVFRSAVTAFCVWLRGPQALSAATRRQALMCFGEGGEGAFQHRLSSSRRPSECARRGKPFRGLSCGNFRGRESSK